MYSCKITINNQKLKGILDFGALLNIKEDLFFNGYDFTIPQIFKSISDINDIKYNNGKMMDIKTKEKSKFVDSIGRIVIKNINEDNLPNDSKKMFIWQGFKTLNPIMSEISLK